jgi:hypothetical protein
VPKLFRTLALIFILPFLLGSVDDKPKNRQLSTKFASSFPADLLLQPETIAFRWGSKAE